MDKLILIDSVYINNSGGKVLLDYFIEKIIQREIYQNFHFLLDYRYSNHNCNLISYTYCHSSEKKRLFFYLKNKNKFSKILCFGNVPPPVNINSKVYLYFHNVLLAESLRGYPLKNKILKYLKRSYIKFLMKNVDEVIVQTKNVRSLFKSKIDSQIKVSIIPFYKLYKINTQYPLKRDEYVYVSNGNPHKNHSFLLDVWEQLAELKIYPILNLTITNDYPLLIKRIKFLKRKGIQINNHGFTILDNLFINSGYMIYPSLKESFGLGLVEAVYNGLKVIGADLPYTYDVIKPSMTFNPNDLNSLTLKLIKIIKEDISLKDSEIVINNKIDELLDLLS